MPISHKTIALFGLFGVGNLGNEASLDAVLRYLRRAQPHKNITVVCAYPQDVSVRHNIEAVSIHPGIEELTMERYNRIYRLAVRALYECIIWRNIYRFLRNVDMVVVPGTGILDDFGISPWQMPYSLLRWTMLAKLAGSRFYFVSIGAGPIHHPLSRLLMKSAARLANYRSYRDAISKEFMVAIGVNATTDPLYPDLVFSLPPPMTARQLDTTKSIGLGVMAYTGWSGRASNSEEIYQTYLTKLTDFTAWLLSNGYSVRLLVGQTTDQHTVDDLQQALAVRGISDTTNRIITEPIETIYDLMEQIALTDLVVATRFHNVLCALMTNRPVISLGYAQKNDVLMAEFGLGEFCQHVERFDVEQLKTQFIELEQQAQRYRHHLRHCNEEYRQALAQQYASIFGGE